MGDAVAVEMVPCPPMSARLTLSACRRMWTSAQEQRPQPWDSRVKCLTCQLGAERAGASAQVAATKAAVESIRTICPSCSRPAARLIHGMRCVSCYNRRREAERGKNCKGGRPRICDALHTESLAVSAPDTAPAVIQIASVLSRPEALVIAARQVAAAGAVFGVVPLRPPAGIQAELFL
jgi:hypothetical protein